MSGGGGGGERYDDDDNKMAGGRTSVPATAGAADAANSPSPPVKSLSIEIDHRNASASATAKDENDGVIQKSLYDLKTVSQKVLNMTRVNSAMEGGVLTHGEEDHETVEKHKRTDRACK